MAAYLAEGIAELGPFEVIYGGDAKRGIPALCWQMKPGRDVAFSLYDFADRLRARGWQVPAYALPANCQSTSIQRILVRQGVSRDLASLLLQDMKNALDYFEKHPVERSLTSAEASGFHH